MYSKETVIFFVKHVFFLFFIFFVFLPLLSFPSIYVRLYIHVPFSLSSFNLSIRKISGSSSLEDHITSSWMVRGHFLSRYFVFLSSPSSRLSAFHFDRSLFRFPKRKLCLSFISLVTDNIN